jgi:cell division protein FtsB
MAEFRRIQNEGLWDENEKLRREIADLKAGRLVFQHWNR